jgi:hypothetical protein
MSDTVTVQLDAVQALADELAALSVSLSEEAGACGEVAPALGAALPGAGERAAAAGEAWAALTGLLADRCRGVAGALSGAVFCYRLQEAVLAARITPDSRPTGPR